MMMGLRIAFMLIGLSLASISAVKAEGSQPGMFNYEQPAAANAVLPATEIKILPAKVNEETSPKESIAQPTEFNNETAVQAVKAEPMPEVVVAFDPNILQDCFAALKKKLTPQELEQFKNKSESQLGEFQSSLVPWISNHWIKPSGSPIREHFNNLGVYRPDEISKMVLIAFHQRLNNKKMPTGKRENIKDKKGKSENKKNKRNRNP